MPGSSLPPTLDSTRGSPCPSPSGNGCDMEGTGLPLPQPHLHFTHMHQHPLLPTHGAAPAQHGAVIRASPPILPIELRVPQPRGAPLPSEVPPVLLAAQHGAEHPHCAPVWSTAGSSSPLWMGLHGLPAGSTRSPERSAPRQHQGQEQQQQYLNGLGQRV